MPYSLKGNSVVKSDSGQVVKTHPTREKALRHLRALKANVEENSPAVLGALLEGAFDEVLHPRGWHGRWIRGRGGKPGRLEGTYNGVKLERGVAYQGKLATGEIHTGTWTGKLTGRGADDPQAQPEFRHVDTGAVRTFQGGEFFGKLADVKPRAPNEQRSDEMASGPLRRVSAADLGRAAPAKITGPSVAVTTHDGRRISMDAARREQTDYRAAHGKPSPFLPSHVKPYTDLTRVRGVAQELAQTRQAISSLRPGGRYDLHGGEGKIGHVLHVSGGRYEVHHGGEVRVHRTPSSAAGHAMKLQRAALASLGARQRGRAGRLQAAAPAVLGALLEGD